MALALHSWICAQHKFCATDIWTKVNAQYKSLSPPSPSYSPSPHLKIVVLKDLDEGVTEPRYLHANRDSFNQLRRVHVRPDVVQQASNKH